MNIFNYLISKRYFSVELLEGGKSHRKEPGRVCRVYAMQAHCHAAARDMQV